MKTKIFGISAKLALAILAVSGSLFTSCYDSVDGDVAVPYTPPTAVYEVTGSITDAETGLPLAASITGDFTASANAKGYFRVELSNPSLAVGAEKVYNVTISAPDYNSVERSITVKGIAAGGVATYVINAALTSGSGVYNDANVTTTATYVKINTVTKTFTAADFGNIENDTDQPTTRTLTIIVDAGARKIAEVAAAAAKTRAADFSSLQAYGDAWIKGQVGDFTKGFVPVNLDVEIQLPPLTRLIGMSINTFYATQNFNFVSAGVDPYNNNGIQSVTGYTVPMPTFESLSHGHSHGHGHGGNLNAGGGIGTSEN